MIDAQALAELLAEVLRHPAVREAARELVAPGAATPTTALLTRRELARQLGVSESTVLRDDRAGAPFELAGKHRRYSLEARLTWSKTAPARKPQKKIDPDVARVVGRAGLTVILGER